MTEVSPTLYFATPAEPRNTMDRLRLFVPIALSAAAFVALTVTAANASPVVRSYNELVLQPGYAPGIPQSPSAAPWYGPASERGYVTRNPPARIRHLEQPAPANACGPGRFEVLNPEPGGGRCFGH